MRIFIIPIIFSVFVAQAANATDKVCQLEGRVREISNNDAPPSLYLAISEGTANEQLLHISGVNNLAELRQQLNPNTAAKLELKISSQNFLRIREAKFIRFVESVPFYDLMIYSSAQDLAAACSNYSSPLSQK